MAEGRRTPPPTPIEGNQTVLELIYAIKALAQVMERNQGAILHRLEAEGRDRGNAEDKIINGLHDLKLVLSHLPVATSDRVQSSLSLIKNPPPNGNIDIVLDSVRRTLDDVRMQLWIVLGRPKGPDASGSGLTVVDGVPVPLEKKEDYTGQITLHNDGNMKVEGKFNAAKIAKVFFILKWAVVSVAAAGGVAGIVKAVLSILGYT